jgi:hypothetical protein
MIRIKVISGQEYFKPIIFPHDTPYIIKDGYVEDARNISNNILVHKSNHRGIQGNYRKLLTQIINDKNIALLNLQYGDVPYDIPHYKTFTKRMAENVLRGVKFQIVEDKNND